MRRFFAFLMLFFTLLGARAQQNVFTFNSLTVPDTGFCNGANLPGFFTADTAGVTAKLYNHYDETYGSWYGFAYSTWTDDTTAGYTNQWSTFAGYLPDSTFVLGYIGIDWTNNYKHLPSGIKLSAAVNPSYVYVSNVTYTALDIINGSAFSSPFSDGDYFYLVIKGFYNGQPTDSVVHFLADYRDSMNFVQKDWAYIDLTKLGTVDSLSFDLFTTDVGDYGPNTPLYFAIDRLGFEKAQTISSSMTVDAAKFGIYPNPAVWNVNLPSFYQTVKIFDIYGHEVINRRNARQIDISRLTPGVYMIKAYDGQQWYSAKFIVNR